MNQVFLVLNIECNTLSSQTRKSLNKGQRQLIGNKIAVFIRIIYVLRFGQLAIGNKYPHKKKKSIKLSYTTA